MIGKGLSEGEKWSNMYQERRWPAGSMKIVDCLVSENLNVHFFSFSMGILPVTGSHKHHAHMLLVRVTYIIFTNTP